LSRINTPGDINAEFGPILRMTFQCSTASVMEGRRSGCALCRSWILLLGLLPIEYDDVAFSEVEQERRFVEESRMWLQGAGGTSASCSTRTTVRVWSTG